MKSQTVQALGCVAVLLLSACGGGGGYGGGGGPPPPPPGPVATGKGTAPTTGPGDSMGYFPFATGNQWQFDFSTNSPTAVAASGVVTEKVTGTQLVQGVNALVLHRADPTLASGGYDTYIGPSAGGVTNLGNTDPTDLLTPQLVPFVEELFPVALGTVSTVTGTALPDGKDQAGNDVTVDLTQTIANAAFESVDVPAGVFANAVRQTTTLNGTVHDNGRSAMLSGVESTWYVPGVGPVKDVSNASGAGTALSSTAGVRSFTVNGQAHGLATPQSIAAAEFAVGVSPAIASDGTNFLIVTQQYTGGVGNPQQQNFIGTLVAADGTTQSFNITAPGPAPASGTPQFAVAGFDGTNYLVIHETDHTATTQPKTLDALLISKAGIVAAPNTISTVVQNSNGPYAEALNFDGTRYLLVYLSAIGQLSGQFVTPATGQADGASFPIRAGGGGIDSPAVGFDGTNYLVAWDEAGVLNTARVSAAGAVLDATPLPIAQSVAGVANAMTPVITFDGTNYLVTYRDYRNEGGDAFNARVSAARISPSLVLVDGSATAPGIHVTSTASVPLGQIAGVYALGTHWLVWSAGSSNIVYGSHVSPAGVALPDWPDGFALAPPASGASLPVIAGGASAAYVAWFVNSAQNQVTPTGMRIVP